VHTKYLHKTVGIIGLALFGVFLLYKNVGASYAPPDITANVVVEGIDYGTFEHMTTLHKLPVQQATKSQPYATVELQRRFISDRPLYEWAQKALETTEPKDVHIVFRRNGKEISQYVLPDCRPVSLEMMDDATGRHERIKLAILKE
jgi:hypothetical protein